MQRVREFQMRWGAAYRLRILRLRITAAIYSRECVKVAADGNDRTRLAAQRRGIQRLIAAVDIDLRRGRGRRPAADTR